jgi:hypothetical protein
VERDPHRPHCCGYGDDADPQVPFCSSFGRARRSRRHRRSIEDIIAQIRHILARHFPHHETSRVTHSLLVFFLRAFHDRILVCCSSSVLDSYVIYLTTKENSFSQVFFLIQEIEIARCHIWAVTWVFKLTETGILIKLMNFMNLSQNNSSRLDLKLF